jgi:hypothetical protein
MLCVNLIAFKVAICQYNNIPISNHWPELIMWPGTGYEEPRGKSGEAAIRETQP